jgi:hypothetical protein
MKFIRAQKTDLQRGVGGVVRLIEGGFHDHVHVACSMFGPRPIYLIFTFEKQNKK